MTAPYVSLLGPISLSIEGVAVPLPGKARTVLAILALNAGRTVTVDQLLESLWGESVTPGATNTLQGYVSRLRNAANDVDFVRRSGPGYLLDVGTDQVDALQFEAVVAESRTYADDPGRVVRSLETGLRLWRGKPLADVEGEPFALGPVTRLEELRTEAWERRYDAELALGNHAAVIGPLEELTADHPLRERFAAQLAIAQYRAGRQAHALQTIARIRERLLEDLALSPGDDLVELERLILNQDPSLAPPRPTLTPRLSELPHAAASGLGHSLVGRGEEMEQLVDAWHESAMARGRLMVVAGEPGVGKTRLMAELAAVVHKSGQRVVWGRCTEQTHLPYEPFVEAVGGARHSRRSATAFTEVLHESALADPEIGLLALHEAVAGELGATLGVGDLIVLDDLQWADAKSVSMFSHVAGSLLSSGVLVLVGRRSGVANPLLDRALSELRRAHAADRINLAGLDETAVAQLVARARGENAALARRLHERTSGNPFFIHELLAADDDLVPPATVADAVALRLGPPDQPLGRLLSAAAVLGRDADVSLLAEVSRLEEEEALTAVDAALAADLLREGGEGSEELSFAHVIVRDVAYRMLTGARRRTLHRRAATAVARRSPLQTPGPDQVVIAQHLLAAGSGTGWSELLKACAAASEWCLRVLAYDQAITLAEQALARPRSVVDPDDETHVRNEASLRLQLAHALNATGNPTGARDHLRQVIKSAQGLHARTGSAEDARLVAFAALGLAGGPGAGVGVRWGVIDHELAWALKSALEVIPADELRTRARLLGALAQAVYNDPAAIDLRDHASATAVEIAERLGDAAVLGHALIARCIAMWGPDGLDERLQLAKRAARIAAREGDDTLAIAAYLRLLPDAFEAADLDTMRAGLAVLDEKTRRLMQPRFRWFPPIARSALALLAGDVATARAEAQAALGVAGDAQADGPSLTFLVGTTMIGRACGDLSGLEDALRERNARDPWNLLPRVLLAVVLAESGRRSDASRALTELLNEGPAALPRDYLWLGELGLLAEVVAQTGATVHAAALHEALTCASGRLLVLGATAPVGAADRALGLLSATLGDHDRALVELSAGRDLHRRIGARPLIARSEVDLSHLHNVRGETMAAEAALARAAQQAGELGMAVPSSPLAGGIPTR